MIKNKPKDIKKHKCYFIDIIILADKKKASEQKEKLYT